MCGLRPCVAGQTYTDTYLIIIILKMKGYAKHSNTWIYTCGFRFQVIFSDVFLPYDVGPARAFLGEA